jgi:hypothetical protein
MRDTIDMAREVGLEEMWELTPRFTARLKAFESLVRADEREACAKVCDARYMGDNSREDMETKRCAKAIRNRGSA